MAQTGKLGTADSQLANLQPAFAAADPVLPTVTAESGRLGGQLGDMVPALGGVIGASVVHLAAESVTALAQSADLAPTFAPHVSPFWALGGQDSQLGDTELAFAGADAPLPTITTQSGRLGGQLGGLVPGLGGLIGGGVIHLSAQSVLAIAQTANPDPTFAPHMSPAWALGGRDAQLAAMEPAFAGAEDARPETGDQTGQLGTPGSLLGSTRPALGEQEGGGGANIVYADAASDLSLVSEAADSVVLRCAATNSVVLSDAAEATRALVCAAESALAVTDAADFTAVRALAAESTLTLADTAANIPGELIEAAVESTLVLDAMADFMAVRTATVESALALGDLAAFAAVRELAAESAPALSVAAARVLPVVIDVMTDSAISLTVAAGRNNIVAASVTSAPDLTSAAICLHVVPTLVSAESTVSLDTAAANTAAHPGRAWDLIDLWDDASVVVVRKLAAESPLALVQNEVTARPWYLSVETSVQTVTVEYDPELDRMVERIEGLQDAASASRPLPILIHQPIPLGQSASVVKVKPTAINVSAESVLELLGEIRPNRTGDVGHWLAFTQSAAVDKCKPARSALELAAEAGARWTGPQDANSPLNLRQSATYSLVAAAVLQWYRPFVGAGRADNPEPPPAALAAPLDGITAPFQLVYPPAGSVTESVTLRAPEFGNRDRLQFHRIHRETRGGTLIVCADPIWPKIQTLVVSFTGLRANESQSLIRFMADHLGEEIGLIDWEQRFWRGVIVNPTDPVVEDRHNSFSAGFEFEGELDPSWGPQVIPVTPGTPLRRVRPALRYCAPLEPEVPVPPSEAEYTAESDGLVAAGQPLYVKATGHVGLAQADLAGAVHVAGLATVAAEPGHAARYISEGSVTLQDWTAVAGATLLAAGSNYFLAAGAPGRFTAIAPTAGGSYVVRIGRAVSTTTFDIEIELPIRL